MLSIRVCIERHAPAKYLPVRDPRSDLGSYGAINTVYTADCCMNFDHKEGKKG